MQIVQHPFGDLFGLVQANQNLAQFECEIKCSSGATTCYQISIDHHRFILNVANGEQK